MTTFKNLAAPVTTGITLALIHAELALAGFGTVPTVGGGTSDVRTTVTGILSRILGFMALVAVAVIIFAGIRLVVGGADETQREKARNTVLFAVVGLIVILLAQAIVQFVEALNVV